MQALFSTGFNIDDFTIDNNDVPYAITTTPFTPSNCFCTTVKKYNYNTNTWEQAGNAEILPVNDPRYYASMASTIATDNKGSIYLAAREAGNGHLTVLKLMNNVWKPVGANIFSAGAAENINLLFVANNKPFVVIADHSAGGLSPFAGHTFYPFAQAWQLNNHTWQIAGNNGFSTYGNYPFTFSIHKNKNIYVAGNVNNGADSLGDYVMAKIWNGSSWKDLGEQPIAKERYSRSMPKINSTTDNEGNFYVVYNYRSIYKNFIDSNGIIVKKYTKSTNKWSTLAGDFPKVFIYAGYESSIIVDDAGAPIIVAFKNIQEYTYTAGIYRYNGTNWQQLPGTPDVSLDTKLLKGKNGAIYIFSYGSISKYNTTNATFKHLDDLTQSNRVFYTSKYTIDTTGIADTLYFARSLYNYSNYSTDTIETFKYYEGNKLSKAWPSYENNSIKDHYFQITAADIAIGTNHTPVLAYYNEEASSLNTAYFNKATYKWEETASPLINGFQSAFGVKLQADKTGTIYGMYNSPFLYAKKLELPNKNHQDCSLQLTELQPTNIALGTHKKMDLLLNGNVFAKEQVILNIGSSLNNKFNYTVTDLNGKIVASSTQQLVIGITTLNLSNVRFGPGIHILSLYNTKGETTNFKLLIQ